MIKGRDAVRRRGELMGEVTELCTVEGELFSKVYLEVQSFFSHKGYG
jgi:hypothetical protein